MRSKVYLVLFISLFLSSFALAQEETLTITTYYPSPYGSYNEFKVASNTWLAYSSGSVGIGTTAPGQTLHVYNNGGTSTGFKTMRLDSNDTTNGTRLLISNSGNTAANNYGFISGGTLLGANKFSIARLNTDSTYSNIGMMVFDASGNVGIGTTNPGSYNLQVISSTNPGGNTYNGAIGFGSHSYITQSGHSPTYIDIGGGQWDTNNKI